MSEIDADWLRNVVVELLRAPTQVPSGSTEVQPGDSRIREAVTSTVVPLIQELAPSEFRTHALGDVAARFGPPSDDGVLLQTYIVSQHANLMSEVDAGRIVDGDGTAAGRRVLGQGASQNKGAMAAAFAAVRALSSDLAKPVWLTVNTEGKSSHDGSRRILDDLGVKASTGILAVGTDLRVSVGNRGRVDVEIVVAGKACHSSQPWLGVNPIEGAADIVRALRTTPLPNEHSILGPATATPYQFSCHPVSPHTIPAQVRLMVDRRLLPGESPSDAAEGVESYLRTSTNNVEFASTPSEYMLPAEVEDESPVVTALLNGVESATGTRGECFWSQNTFDAGYACSKGIPTVMFGPGKRSFAGSGLLAEDSVSFADMSSAANAIVYALRRLCQN